jgi:hypothetical protein
MPLLTLCDFYHHAFSNDCICIDVDCPEDLLCLIQHNLRVILCVAHNLRLNPLRSLFLAVIVAHNPDTLFSTYVVSICGVAVKDFSNFSAAILFVLSVNLLPFGSRSARSRIELTNVQYRELVESHQFTRFLVLRSRLQRESAD